MVENPILRRELIENCWIGDYWCFEASPYGIFHCEVGFGLAMLQGFKGWEIERRWWERDTMADQLYLCELCGGCIPMEKQLLCDGKEKISSSFLQILADNRLPVGDYELITKPFSHHYMAEWSKVWRPSQYRNETDEEAEATGAFLGNRIDWRQWLIDG
jgi:hypothetical protein